MNDVSVPTLQLDELDFCTVLEELDVLLESDEREELELVTELELKTSVLELLRSLLSLEGSACVLEELEGRAWVLSDELVVPKRVLDSLVLVELSLLVDEDVSISWSGFDSS